MEKLTLQRGGYAYVDKDGELVARKCNKCGEEKNASDFGDDASKRFGKSTKCKVCQSEYDKVRQNRAEIRDKEKARLANRYLNNKDGMKAQALKWSRENPERRKEIRKRWEGVNLEKRKALMLRRRARVEGLIDDLSHKQVLTIEEHFGGRGVCALTGELRNKVHLDHVIPIATGCGGTTIGNMIPLTPFLNQSKSDKNIFVWFRAHKERLGLEQERFNDVIAYLAELNGMTIFEYTAKVYESFIKEV